MWHRTILEPRTESGETVHRSLHRLQQHTWSCRSAEVVVCAALWRLEGRYPHPQTGIPKADLMAEVGVSAAGIQYLARGLAKVLARKSRFTFYLSVWDNNSSVTTVEGIWCAVGLLYASVLRSVQGLFLLLVSLCFSSEDLSLVCLKGQVCLWGISQLLLHEELWSYFCYILFTWNIILLSF